MNKEEYLEKRKIIKDNIYEQNNNLDLLEEQYIKDNVKFEIGEKVKIIDPEHDNTWNNKIVPESIEFGFVANNYIDYYSGNIKQNIEKCKKDGTRSKHALYLNYRQIVEKIK